ncbi:MAG TPA: HPF/RaiA family ribosome-associated protein [Candidatus Acidoferrales bacterium]|nr:HPF/RaiA family ribosome-associated protein [Candidatus Acidoferrales bacterium]
MKISVSYRGLENHNGFEKLVGQYCGKMEKLLTAYNPDLVQCHAAIEYHPKKGEYALSLNLVLPTGTLHALNTAKAAHSTVRVAFAEVQRQLKKHKEKLRHDYEWKRKRDRDRGEALSEA